MRILYYIDSLNIGGAEKLLLEMLESFRDNHNLHVAYFTEGSLRQEVEAMGIPVTRLSTRGLKDPRAFLASMRLIQSFKPDIIHTHLSKSDIVGQVTGGVLGVPVRISSLHNTDPWRKNPFWSRVMMMLTAGCQKMIAVSGNVAEFVETWSDISSERLVTIDNGISLDKFDPDIVQPLDLSQWDIPSDKFIIGVVGRLNPQKGHSIFLEMAHTLLQQHDNLHFLIVGDGAIRGDLEQQAQALGINEGVTFTGFLNDMPVVLASLDILVFSSLWEGLPVTLLEAMAMKRPIVTTDVGGIPEVINDGQNGRMVTSGDPQALAEACSQLIEQPQIRQRLGEAGRTTIREEYDQHLMHTKILQIYQDILNGR